MAATISSVPASDLRCTNLLHFWQVTDSSCSLRATPTIFSAFCNRPLLCHLWWSLFAQVFAGFWDRLFPEFFLHKIKLLKRGLWVVLQCWWPIGPFIFYWSVFSWKRVTWDYSTPTGVWKPLRRKITKTERSKSPKEEKILLLNILELKEWDSHLWVWLLSNYEIKEKHDCGWQQQKER